MRILSLVLLAGLLLGVAPKSDDIRPLEIGQPAPPFNLQGTDDAFYSLDSFADAEVLAVVFTCNHCPTAQAYEQHLMDLTAEYADKGVAVVAISPNDPASVRLDELGYTDLNDSLEEMKIRAEDMGFNFTYLYDGDVQEVSRAYGPTATPHVFIFDKDRMLRFQGRIDNREKIGAATEHDTRNAIDALLAEQAVPVETTKVFGCSIKWSDKSAGVNRAWERWKKEAVTVSSIDVEGVQALVKNESENMMMINVWSTWCGPCITEYPDLMEIYRMYRGRDFTYVSISMDQPDRGDDVLEFLQSQYASNTNYHFDDEDPYALIDALDPEWPGALPYTIMIKPGGEVFFRQLGVIDPLELKREIVGYVGRYYD